MSKKIFTLLFLMLVLISVSAVSAADLDDNNDTIVSSVDAGALAVANDVDAIDDLSENVAGGDDGAIADDANSVADDKNNDGATYELLAASDDNNVLENENDGEILKETSSTWYVDANAASGGDGKSEATAFQNLEEAVNKSADNDTIRIASGTYSGDKNTGLTIDKVLSFEKYGDDEAVFDAEGLNRIWTVNAATININGLTFKNGKSTGSETGGGAIHIKNALSNSIINATFINNTFPGSYNSGGAILFDKAADNVKIYGEFINNTVELTQNAYGGAISFRGAVNNSIINATFTDNSASSYGGALYFENDVDTVGIYGEFKNNKAIFNQNSNGGAISFRKPFSNSIINAIFINNTADNGGAIHVRGTSAAPNPITNVDISGKFIDNTGKDIINIYSVATGNKIHDAVFLNNVADKIINIVSGTVNASDNWFGNNATNYDQMPANVGIDLDNWLFLNATADSNEIRVGESATIAFNLYNKNSPGVEYDASKMNIVLDLDKTLGELDKNETSLGEEITYTAKEAGDASVSGKLETASYAVSLKNNKGSAQIILENETMALKVNDNVSSGAALAPAGAGNLTYTSSNESVIKVENGIIKAMGEGTATITVSFNGNDNYVAAENKTITVNVALNDASVSVNNSTLNLFVYEEFTIVATTAPKGLDVTFVSDNSGVVSVDENGVVTALKGGTASIIVKVGGNGVYAENSTTVTVTVRKLSPEITLENDTIALIAGNNVFAGAALTPADAGNLTYTSSNESIVRVENGIIKAISSGTANITVSFEGNDYYLAAENRTITVTVTSVWYVDANVASSGDGKSNATAFKTLKDALDKAKDNDTIMIASGTYSGDENIGLTFDKVLSFEKYGDGEATFDAQGQNSRIWEVQADTINIIGLTFKNGNSTMMSNKNGGAIIFSRGISNSIINATFINNFAYGYGGAIYFDGPENNVSIYGEFRDNQAEDGGALYFFGVTSNSTINATFTSNTARDAGAILFYYNVYNVSIYGKFMANTATVLNGGAITALDSVHNSKINAVFRDNVLKDNGMGSAFLVSYGFINSDVTGSFINNAGFYTITAGWGTNTTIHDAIFLNNWGYYKIIDFRGGDVTLNNLWFGNTAANYNAKPNVGRDLDNWLFLNATANPDEVEIDQNSTITFKLQSYNGSQVADYDASKMDIVLELSQTLGELDKAAALIGEEITYTAREAGNASVKAKFNGAPYTVNFKNNKKSTSILLENDTVALKANEEISAGATLNPTGVGNLTYDTNDSSVAKVVDGKIIAVGAGHAVITVSFAGTDVYAAAENTINVTVTAIDASVNVSKTEYNLFVGDKDVIVAIASPDGLNVSFTTDQDDIVSIDENGTITALKEGTATIFVSVGDNVVYKYASKEINVTVRLKDASVSVNNSTLDLEVDDKFTIVAATAPEGLNVTFVSDNSGVVSVDENGVVTALKGGTASIIVKINGNGIYVENSTTVTVTVRKLSAEITLENDAVALYVNGNVSAGATLTPDAGNLTYTSSNESVVIVENGIIKAIGEGNATITVSSTGNDRYLAAENKTITVNVALNDASVSVNNSTLDLFVGDNLTIVATTTPEGLNVTFVPDDSGVVRVDSNGVVTALKNGTASIIVKVGGDGVYVENSTTVAVTVSKIPTEIIIENTTIDMKVTDVVDPVVSLMPSGAGELDFTSSDVSVVTVSGIGTITAVGEGVANVTVRFIGNDKYESAESKNITVTVSLHDASVSMNNSTLDLIAGDNFTIVATTTPAGLNVTYVPDNSGVVSVDENGVVTALKGGNATIAVKVGGDGVYAENSTTVAVTVSKCPTNISVVTDNLDLKVLQNLTAGANLTPADAGNLTYTSSNESIVKVENGTIKAIGAGNATITVSFAGDDKYLAAENKTINVTVSLNDVIINVSNSTVELIFGESYAINATTVPEGLNLTYVVDDSGVVSVDENGTVTTLKLGIANILVKFNGDNVYAENSTVVTVKVTVDKIEIPPEEAFNFTSLENSTQVISVNLPDEVTGFVLLDIAGKQTHVPLVKGKANVTIPKLAEGTYNATITYIGDDLYAPVTTTMEINVTSNVPESALSIPDSSKSDAPTTYSISLPSDAGGFLEVDVDGKQYSAPVINGSATVSVPDLSTGNHNVTVRYTGDENYSPVTKETTLNVAAPVFKLSNNKDVSAICSAKATYKVLVTKDGKVVGADEKVTFNYNGKTYTVRTDKNGYATLKLKTNLKVKTYTITATYKGVKVTNKVTIKHAIKAKNKKVKKSKKVNKVKVSLKKANGKYLKNKVIKIKFKGKLYKLVTNKKGVATWKVKKSMLKKLKVGKKYKYKISYGKDTVTKKLTIKK